MTNTWDTVIIGGSVAGLSAAQMLGRSLRRTLVIDAGEPRNRFAAHMHGVLGQDGADPAALLATGRAEAAAYGVAFASATVARLEDAGERIRVLRADGSEDAARTVLIATGVRDVLPAIPGLAEEWGRTVLHCPYCHGYEVAGVPLGVLATSPAAIHQAQLVRQLTDDVTVFAGALGPLDDDVARRFRARGIRVAHAAVTRVAARSGGITVTTADGSAYDLGAIFAGGEPELALGFADGLGLARQDAPGAPLAVDAMGRTSHPRVFAAGGVVAPFANVPVSMGAGSMAGAGANAVLAQEDTDRAVAAA
ncbi:NAD(P)/FAD-dependent oxidoreductase [Microbacterium excoecariae]|uniref:NAD(P)/FAD-dependent oxidoreductase n=1 Tax=Microbacterium excoecariae TaxID=2715210 RepID=UPI0014083141|nr:NAD(P)/FAD-dependent oxidoreductase [Microbacterium excoecariae]NHI15945.1 NAD(P)/FAD-dependent oxidoreductase [Microbacterium excoecariae]